MNDIFNTGDRAIMLNNICFIPEGTEVVINLASRNNDRVFGVSTLETDILDDYDEFRKNWQSGVRCWVGYNNLRKISTESTDMLEESYEKWK